MSTSLSIDPHRMVSGLTDVIDERGETVVRCANLRLAEHVMALLRAHPLPAEDAAPTEEAP